MLSDWVHAETDQTHKIALPRLFSLLYRFMINELSLDSKETEFYLLKDFNVSGIKGQPKFMEQSISSSTNKPVIRRSESRQKRHQIKD